MKEVCPNVSCVREEHFMIRDEREKEGPGMCIIHILVMSLEKRKKRKKEKNHIRDVDWVQSVAVSN